MEINLAIDEVNYTKTHTDVLIENKINNMENYVKNKEYKINANFKDCKYEIYVDDYAVPQKPYNFLG